MIRLTDQRKLCLENPYTVFLTDLNMVMHVIVPNRMGDMVLDMDSAS